MNSLQLKLTQEQWRIQQFCPELEQFMILQNVHERQRFKVIICVLEAINNILDHTEAGLEQIVLIMHCNDDRIIVDLLDHSTVLPKIEPHHCPEQMNEHGRGLWIMYNWMDEVRFQPTVLGTHLRLILLRRH